MEINDDQTPDEMREAFTEMLEQVDERMVLTTEMLTLVIESISDTGSALFEKEKVVVFAAHTIANLENRVVALEQIVLGSDQN